jgi:Kef-type K+ transport system membrane component KefB
MSNWQTILYVVALLGTIVVVARITAALFERLGQPRVAGEIVGGIVVQGAVWLLVRSDAWPVGLDSTADGGPAKGALGILAIIGAVTLMLFAGLATRTPASAAERRRVGLLAILDFGIPFISVLVLASWLPIDDLAGPAKSRTALILVVAVATAVTSVPVISKIFHDLGILHTRFASLVLSVALLGDSALWAVLAVATGIASAAALAPGEITARALLSLAYLAVGLFVAPKLVMRVAAARWNALARDWPVAFATLVFAVYLLFASLAHVNLAFGAFLAGVALGVDARIGERLKVAERAAFGIVVPAYFAAAGFRLGVFGAGVSWWMLVSFLFLSSAVKLLGAGLGAAAARYRGLDLVNFAVTTNARGGPGIIVATIAYDAGIITQAFYAVLVLTAVLTSQAAGVWLRFVLRRGWPLLSGEAARPASPEELEYAR